jgi:hypothetical protein
VLADGATPVQGSFSTALHGHGQRERILLPG